MPVSAEIRLGEPASGSGPELSGPRPAPILLHARLAVALHSQGQGVGKALCATLCSARRRRPDIAGIRAFTVHAKDDEAKRFYEKLDFIPSPADPMHLFVLLEDVRRIISACQARPASATNEALAQARNERDHWERLLQNVRGTRF